MAATPDPTAVLPDAIPAVVDATDKIVPGSPTTPVAQYRRPLATTWIHAVRKILRVGLSAIAARVCFGIIKVLLRKRFGRGTSAALADECLNLNPFKWAAVFSSLAAFRPVLITLERVFLRLAQVVVPGIGARSADVALTRVGVWCHRLATVASALAVSQSVRVMEVPTQTELALYMASRASHGFATEYVFPNLPAALRDFGHWDVVGIGLTGAQILYAIVFAPDSHSKSYMAFLQKCTMMTSHQCEAIGALHRRSVTPNTLAYCEQVGIAPPSGPQDFAAVCRVLHRGGSCDVAALRWCKKHLLTVSLPLYVPLKTITTLTFGWKGAVKDPLAAVKKIVTSAVKSSLFLTLYCGGPHRVICMMTQLNAPSPWRLGVAAGASCALATFLEPKSRRLDLVLYCNMHAFRSAWLVAYQRGYLNRPTRGLVMLLYVLSLTTVLVQYETSAHCLHPNIRGGLDFISAVARPKPAASAT